MAKQEARVAGTSGAGVKKPSAISRRRTVGPRPSVMLQLRRFNDWKELLEAEKKRRRVSPNQLVFIGCRNVAQYWWCAEFSLLMSRQNEIGFFLNYLHDRLDYSQKLGLIGELPDDPAKWLSIGQDITQSDIERLLAQTADQKLGQRASRGPASMGVGDTIYLNPGLSPEERAANESFAAAEGLRIGDLNENPKIRGRLLEGKAEHYPTLSWHWQWEQYVVVGVPDGITGHLVYEFKTAGNKFLAGYSKRPAMTQADLYGHFWSRSTKRVQLRIMDSGLTDTSEVPVDSKHAVDTLNRFRRLDLEEPPIRPKDWKCRSCNFRQGNCPLCP